MNLSDLLIKKFKIHGIKNLHIYLPYYCHVKYYKSLVCTVSLGKRLKINKLFR